MHQCKKQLIVCFCVTAAVRVTFFPPFHAFFIITPDFL
jgi:hypothetical protein